jgi:arylsulfatase A-like enzyme
MIRRLLITVGIACWLLAGGCRGKTAVENAEASPPDTRGPSDGEAPKGTQPDGEEPPAPWQDLVAARDVIEMGTTDGGRFVDLRRLSGRWSLRDGGAASHPATPDAEEGWPLDVHPLLLRLYEKDVAGGRIFLVVASKEKQTLTFGAGEPVSVGEGLSMVPVGPPPAGPSGAIDISCTAGGRSGTSHVLGFWIWPSSDVPPHDPPAPAPCDGGSGLRIRPGDTLVATVALPSGVSLRAKASGKGSGALWGSVTVDGLDTQTLAFGSSGIAGDPSSSWTADLPAHGDLVPAEIVIGLPPSAAGESCIDEWSVLKREENPALPATRPDGVVLVMADTMRGDLYAWHRGSGSSTMSVSLPTLEALAASSYRFVNATAHASYTKPSVATMLTGLYPAEHGGLGRKKAVAAGVPLLPEILGSAGVPAFSVLSNYFFNTRFGMNRGWTGSEWAEPFASAIDDGVVLEALEKLLSSTPHDGPFFLYIHLMGAHAPYAAPVEERAKIAARLLSPAIAPMATTNLVEKFSAAKASAIHADVLEDLRGLYRADALRHDAIMDSLVGLLRKTGILDRAILLYTSDHGEEFFEHGGLGHARSLWSEQIDVPLLMHLPGQTEGADLQALTGHIDIAPTVLHALGQAVPDSMSGLSLLHVVGEETARTEARGLLIQHWTGISGVRVGRYKLLHLAACQDALTVERDGKEETLVPGDHPVTMRLLRKKETALMTLAGAKSGLLKGGGPDVTLNDETLEQLEKLGYVFTADP